MKLYLDRFAIRNIYVMAGLDPAIQITLKELYFLPLDGRLKGGHDVVYFSGCEANTV